MGIIVKVQVKELIRLPVRGHALSRHTPTSRGFVVGIYHLYVECGAEGGIILTPSSLTLSQRLEYLDSSQLTFNKNLQQ